MIPGCDVMWGSIERRLAIAAYTAAVERVQAHERAAAVRLAGAEREREG